MKNQTIKKDTNNRGEKDLEQRLRSVWLEIKDSNCCAILKSRNPNI